MISACMAEFLIYCDNKPIIRIGDAEIWFKLLRNFGEFIKFFRIQCHFYDLSNELKTKIPNALKNLIIYVHEYCTDSLEILELRCYPFFCSNKPLIKLKKFFAPECFQRQNIGIYQWEHRITELSELMPNLNSLYLTDVPKILEEHFPKLERVELTLKCKEDVHSFNSFLHLNRQIIWLKLFIFIDEQSDLIFSSIEENLTQLNFLYISNSYRLAPTRTYQFKTIKEFKAGFFTHFKLLNSIQFEDLKKLYIHWVNQN